MVFHLVEVPFLWNASYILAMVGGVITGISISALAANGIYQRFLKDS